MKKQVSSDSHFFSEPTKNCGSIHHPPSIDHPSTTQQPLKTPKHHFFQNTFPNINNPKSNLFQKHFKQRSELLTVSPFPAHTRHALST
jgi:hypothetical protein